MSSTMNSWNQLYERPPLGIDALLLVVALLLHAPLAMIHMSAPAKHKKNAAGRLHDIGFIEEQIKKKKANPVSLPPKIQTAKEIIKKAEDMKQLIIKRTLPPPPPPRPKIQEDIIKGPDMTKLEEKILKDKLDPQKQALQSKGAFAAKQLALNNPQTAAQIKVGEAAALQANSRLAGMGAAGGPVLQSKSGFQVSKGAVPGGIGGDGDLKVSGGEAIAIPVGARARGDANIMSPTAVIQNKGSLGSKGGPLMASAANSTGLAGGGPAGGAIAIPSGGSRMAPGGGSLPMREEKKLTAKALPNPIDTKPLTAPSAPLAPAALPRRVVAQRPMFLITGPLANRTVLHREIPAYPDWARAKGIEATVTLQFSVTPEGAVKDNILVVRTSGYPQMDDIARDALKLWKFATLPEGQWREEIGTITFNFSVQ